MLEFPDHVYGQDWKEFLSCSSEYQEAYEEILKWKPSSNKSNDAQEKMKWLRSEYLRWRRESGKTIFSKD